MSNLRTEISELINDINKLLLVCQDEDECNRLRMQRQVLTTQLIEVLEQQINQSTVKYSKTVESLQKAVSLAKDAKQDLDKVSAAIRKVASAINKVEGIIRMGIRFVA